MFDRFTFPPVSERDHLYARLSNLCVAAFIAILPLVINFIWRLIDISDPGSKNTWPDIYRAAITDSSSAGIVVAVATYTNTYFNDAKLAGWKGGRSITFVALCGVATCAILSFVAYIQTTHLPSHPGLYATLFFGNISLLISNFLFSVLAIYTFTLEEIRNADDFSAHLPE